MHSCTSAPPMVSACTLFGFWCSTTGDLDVLPLNDLDRGTLLLPLSSSLRRRWLVLTTALKVPEAAKLSPTPGGHSTFAVAWSMVSLGNAGVLLFARSSGVQSYFSRLRVESQAVIGRSSQGLETHAAPDVLQRCMAFPTSAGWCAFLAAQRHSCPKH
eukprot:1764210-Amphidinium_carterae.1